MDERHRYWLSVNVMQRRTVQMKKQQAAILEADGRLEASRRDAEAQVVLAESSQRAIEMITTAVGDKEIPVAYLLGEHIESNAGSI